MVEGKAEQEHIRIDCSNCNKPLVDLWLIHPIEQTFRLRANCPYCGDKSFIKEINWRFHIGPPNDSLSCTSINYGEELITINVEKKNE